MMLSELGDEAIDTTLFDAAQPPFSDQVLQTTWEELARQKYVELIGTTQYRLTSQGWLVGLELSGAVQSPTYQERVGRLLAAMKRHVKARTGAAIVQLRQLADESGEPEGWIFNVIDSKASATGNQRTGARWHSGDRGRLVEIPVDFNLEPIDIAAALTIEHLQRIRQLEERLEELKADRARFHCPYCDAEISDVGHQDFPDYHCVVTYERFACGYCTADGFEASPCPYGPHWPTVEEFEFVAERQGSLWVCSPRAKTARARQVHISQVIGQTKEETEEKARKAAAPKNKGR